MRETFAALKNDLIYYKQQRRRDSEKIRYKYERTRSSLSRDKSTVIYDRPLLKHDFPTIFRDFSGSRGHVHANERRSNRRLMIAPLYFHGPRYLLAFRLFFLIFYVIYMRSFGSKLAICLALVTLCGNGEIYDRYDRQYVNNLKFSLVCDFF